MGIATLSGGGTGFQPVKENDMFVNCYVKCMKYYGITPQTIWPRLRCFMFALILPVLFAAVSFAGTPAEKKEVPTAQTSENGAWTGIDVSIVGKYAEKYGRPPREPYINTDKGDLLLFVFTLAGVVGGFVIGFNARKLFYEK